MSRTGATAVPDQLDRTPDDDARIGVEARGITLWEHRKRSDGSPGTHEIRFALPADVIPAELPPVTGGVTTRGRNVEISTDDPTRDLLALIWWAAGRGAARLNGLTVTRPSLEDKQRALPARPAGMSEAGLLAFGWVDARG
jgi:hypothetical protein